MQNPVKLQRAMVVNTRFSYATLERHTGLSRSYVFKKVREYEDSGYITRAGLGNGQEKLWRLTQEGRRQFDPNAPRESVLNTLEPGQNQGAVKKERPEYRVWTAMHELKTFTFYDLSELKLAGDTLIRQYLTLLKRAGILSTRLRKETPKGQYEGRYIKSYTMTDKAGPLPPLVGRCFYVFDPNTGEYHTTDLMTFDSDNRLTP